MKGQMKRKNGFYIFEMSWSQESGISILIAGQLNKVHKTKEKQMKYCIQFILKRKLIPFSVSLVNEIHQTWRKISTGKRLATILLPFGTFIDSKIVIHVSKAIVKCIKPLCHWRIEARIEILFLEQNFNYTLTEL